MTQVIRVDADDLETGAQVIETAASTTSALSVELPSVLSAVEGLWGRARLPIIGHINIPWPGGGGDVGSDIGDMARLLSEVSRGLQEIGRDLRRRAGLARKANESGSPDDLYLAGSSFDSVHEATQAGAELGAAYTADLSAEEREALLAQLREHRADPFFVAAFWASLGRDLGDTETIRKIEDISQGVSVGTIVLGGVAGGPPGLVAGATAGGVLVVSDQYTETWSDVTDQVEVFRIKLALADDAALYRAWRADDSHFLDPSFIAFGKERPRFYVEEEMRSRGLDIP